MRWDIKKQYSVGGYLQEEPFDIKKFLFGKISRRMTFLFLIIGIVAPTIGIYYFYSLSVSTLSLSQNIAIYDEQKTMLQSAAILIITLIALDAAIFGYFASHSITRPLENLHRVTKEIEKGNFDIKANIKTKDELEELGKSINKTTIALSEMNQERLQIDRAKSEFLSITSHELRTPMTPMKAQLQMLEKDYFGKLNEKQKDSVRIIRRNAERLDRIIEDFLEISRIEAARLKFIFRKIDIKKTVEETVKFLEGFAKEKNIDLIVKADNLPNIQADPDRISQIIRNLTHNAIKFSRVNGKIEISAATKKDHILFIIKDNGLGMSTEDQLRVFEPFYQIEDHLNRKHGGTGLGLAICRGIVESQKGKIWVESTKDKGSTFYFTIPLKPVEEIEPIKVLFSSKSEIENKIMEEFTSILGPMGIVEFDDLKNKNSLKQDDLLFYIDTLENQNIINTKLAEKFKINIGKIYGIEFGKNDNNETLNLGGN